MMPRRCNIWLLNVIFFLLSAVPATAQIYNTQVEAKIILKSNSEFIQVTGSAYNKTGFSQSLRYVLSVIKNPKGTSNSSKNDQSGRFVLTAGEQKNLSQTTINLDDSDRIIILLLVYDTEDKLLGKDRIVLNDDKGDKKIILPNGSKDDSDLDRAYASSDGVELRGFVLEETKTRPGREFFTKFATAYRNSQINGAKIVTIREVLALANNTQIEVKVDDVVIMQFFVRPQNDYMDAMGQEAMRRVRDYFRALEEDKIVVKQY